MKSDTADDLYFKVLHSHASPRRLSAHRKGFRQQVVEALASCDSFLKFSRLAPQLLVGKRRHLILQRNYAVRNFFNFFYFFGV